MKSKFSECPDFSCSRSDGTLEPVKLPFPPGGGGGYFRNFWVGMCRWDPGTLSLN